MGAARGVGSPSEGWRGAAAAAAHAPPLSLALSQLGQLPSLPLRSTFPQWGNPNEGEFFEYIKSYSPMDNVSRQRYAPMLLEGGLHDTRVAYWEPVKFAQRVRAAHTGSPSDILCKIEMDEVRGKHDYGQE